MPKTTAIPQATAIPLSVSIPPTLTANNRFDEEKKRFFDKQRVKHQALVDYSIAIQPVITEEVTTPVIGNGRMPAACLYNRVMTLHHVTPSPTIAFVERAQPETSSVSCKPDTIYERQSRQPLPKEIVHHANATMYDVLRDRPVESAPAVKTIIHAVARDRSIRDDAPQSSYNECAELADGTPSPFHLACLQRLFLSMGGQPAGTYYPTAANHSWYNSLGNWGTVKQFLQQLVVHARSRDGGGQQLAMRQLLGISPPISRAPYAQGVEVFWFAPRGDGIAGVAGLLRRSIERDLVQIPSGKAGAFGAMVQLLDLRAPNDFAVRFRVTATGGYWITVNQPAELDHIAMTQPYSDRPGWVERYGVPDSALTNEFTACSAYSAETPNMMKLFCDNGGRQDAAFLVQPLSCTTQPIGFQSPYYSLTCEARAPFLSYEVGSRSGVFEETRLPGIFAQFLTVDSPEYHHRHEERARVPGKKAFVRVCSTSFRDPSRKHRISKLEKYDMRHPSS